MSWIMIILQVDLDAPKTMQKSQRIVTEIVCMYCTYSFNSEIEVFL